MAALAATVRTWVTQPDFALTPETTALLLLNLLDGLFTLLFLQLGVAQELNPVMDLAYQAGPGVFIAVKLGVVDLGMILLCLHREYRFARWALSGGALLYAGVVVYHLSFLAWLTCG